MLKIKARDVLTMTPSYMLTNFPEMVNVIYDDGNTVVSKTKALVYSWFIWEFHRRYSFLPLTFDHHVDSELKDKMLSANTHIDMFGKILKQLVFNYNMTGDHQKEEIYSLIYEITNNLHNELPKLSARYVMTLDILDILQLANDPDIVTMKENLEPKAGAIEDFYNAANKLILQKEEYKENNLVHYLKMNILNKNQVNQCILARGYPIEVDGNILSTPIMTCYAIGMYKLYDYVGDSRGASKHLYAAEAPLQQAEYFARRLQLAGTVITGISKEDCGTKNYITWTVKAPEETSTGRVVRSSDLKFMKGKYYLDEESSELKVITGKETHLYGKMIKLRSVLVCEEKDPHKVCPTCFGQLHHNVSRFANLGHLCDANLTHQTTQTLLSTKHHIGSAVGTEILLKEDAQRYLTFSYSNMSFLMKPMNPTSKYRMIVNRSTALGLTDLKLLSNIDNINPKRFSSLTEITIQEIMSNGAVVQIEVKIEQNKRFGYFSYEFLQYLKDNDWTTNEYDHFVFDLSNWNPKLPMIRIPDMEYSYSDHVDKIADLIESKAKSLNGRARPDSPVQLLEDLFDLVNSKISVNISLLEVMVYAVMTPSADNFGLTRNVSRPIVNVARNIITNRSISAAWAYEDQFDTLTNPRSFFQENRPDSPLDVLFTPREVVKYKYELQNSVYS